MRIASKPNAAIVRSADGERSPFGGTMELRSVPPCAVLLPDFENASIEPAKVVVYLLGTGAQVRSAKARFFRDIGFRPDRWDLLAAALRLQALQSDLRSIPTPWGAKWVATGRLDAPNGRGYNLTSVWIEAEAGVRLVTAYPRKEWAT